ncbi:MAG: IS1182 family transposase [Anaerolineales bacterium]
MSLHPEKIEAIPAETVRIAQAAFPRGNVYMRMRDEVGPLYADEEFTALFAQRGQPAEAPWRLAWVSIMQFMEGLSDRQTADAVRGRLDWKYALGLELTDAGFDASVLSEFRTRLIEGQAEHHLLEKMLSVFKAKGWLKARGRQRTDATHVLAAVRAVSYLVCVGETMRYVLNQLAEAEPDWLAPYLPAEWRARYGRRLDESRLPKEKTERQALAETIGRDGVQLWQAVCAPETPARVRQHPAVEVLRRVWLQQYYQSEDGLQWRSMDNRPPAAQMIVSPYDLDARLGKKRETTWLGYKAHLTETCDDDQPHVLTHVVTTPATTNDCEVPDDIHADLARQDLLPHEHFLDAGYVESRLIVSGRETYDLEVVGPVPASPSWQAKAQAGFDTACFRVDWEHERVTCPAGQTSTKWSHTHDAHHNPIINIRFSDPACRACPQHARCTKSAGARHLTLRPRSQHEALQAARANQQTPEFQARYRRRAGIEGTFSQADRLCDLRRSRYIGRAKTHLQHILTAAALNVHRLFAWLEGEPFALTRVAPFVQLMPTTG